MRASDIADGADAMALVQSGTADGDGSKRCCWLKYFPGVACLVLIEHRERELAGALS